MTYVIHNDDCFRAFSAVADESVDLVLADMPYGRTNCDWDTPIDLDQLWVHLNRVANGAVLLFGQCPYDKIIGASNISNLRYEWVWEKTNATGHLNAKKMPMKAHEVVLVFYKSLPTYNPQKTYGHKRKTATKHGDKSVIYGKQHLDSEQYDSTERYPRDVIKFASDKQKSKLHPTQKPVALLEYFIKTYTNEGDTVLDFCMGSGSTGVAALKNNRHFIGFEKEVDFFNKARKRIMETQKDESEHADN